MTPEYVGQFRADECPLCGTPDKQGRWTCSPCTDLVTTYKGLIKGLQSWHSSYEAGQVSDILCAGGSCYCLWDIDEFYASRRILPTQMRLSIEYCLYEGMIESDAAIRMGIAPTNPILIYSTIGVTYMLAEQGMNGYLQEEAS